MRIPRLFAALSLAVCASVPFLASAKGLTCGQPDATRTDTVQTTDADETIASISFDAAIDRTSRAQIEKVLDDAAKLPHRPQALLIVFNSPGGDVDEGQRIARDFEQSEVPVFCVVDGEAASMGFYVLQSCRGRFMTTRSTLMAHEPSNGAPMVGNRFDHERWAESLKVTALAMAEHESKRLHISYEEFLKRTHDGDYDMGWDQAQAIGAVDHVFGTVEEATRYLRERVRSGQ